MNREVIIRMAREACETTNWKPGLGNEHVVEFMARFAALAVAWGAKQEREACAKVCEPQSAHDDPLTAWKIAAAIRSRGEVQP